MSVLDVQEFDVICTGLGGRCRRFEFLRKINVWMRCLACSLFFVMKVSFCQSGKNNSSSMFATSRDAKGCFSLATDLFSRA